MKIKLFQNFLLNIFLNHLLNSDILSENDTKNSLTLTFAEPVQNSENILSIHCFHRQDCFSC